MGAYRVVLRATQKSFGKQCPCNGVGSRHRMQNRQSVHTKDVARHCEL